MQKKHRNGQGIHATLKQKRWATAYLKSGNKTQAALEAYPNITKNTAGQLGYRNSKSPAVKSYMAEILNIAGLTDDKIARSLGTIVEAGLSKRSLRKAAPQDALRAIDISTRLKDLYPAEKKDIRKASISIDLENKTSEELVELLKRTQQDIVNFSTVIKESANIEAYRKEHGDEAYYDSLRQGNASSDSI